MPSAPLITLLTDFGLADHYVAAMKGVILSICPEARIVDISHDIRPYDIASGSYTLGQAYPYFPEGSIHVAVVDPGVGSDRRPVLVESGGYRFVGPDNGIFTFPLCTGGCTVHALTSERYFLSSVSSTFHGRDIFAPVAAHLARGVDPAEFGQPVADPVRLKLTERVAGSPGEYIGKVLSVDRFGNVVTSFRLCDLPEMAGQPFEIRIGGSIVSRNHETYSAAARGEMFAISGSSGFLEVSINQADAAGATGVAPGDPVGLRLREVLVLESP